MNACKHTECFNAPGMLEVSEALRVRLHYDKDLVKYQNTAKYSLSIGCLQSTDYVFIKILHIWFVLINHTTATTVRNCSCV